MVRPSVFIGLLVATLLISSGCATDGGSTAVPETTAAADTDLPAAPSGERLIAQAPNGWQQTGATNIGTLRRAEFRPVAEIASDPDSDWTRRITFESLKEDPLPDPLEFVELMSAGRDRDCGTFRAHPTFAGEENGYPTAVYLLVCHQDRQTERSEVTLMKTIRGNEFFYVITRGLRGDPIPKDGEPAVEKEEIGGWAVYLRSVTLCDTDRPEAHPCPATAEP